MLAKDHLLLLKSITFDKYSQSFYGHSLCTSSFLMFAFFPSINSTSHIFWPYHSKHHTTFFIPSPVIFPTTLKPSTSPSLLFLCLEVLFSNLEKYSSLLFLFFLYFFFFKLSKSRLELGDSD